MNLSRPFNRIATIMLAPVFFLTTAFQSPHSYVYDIYLGNNPIGTVTVRQQQTPEGRTITMQSRVQSKLMARMEVDITTAYHQNVLQESIAVRKGGEPLTSVKRSGKSYVIVHKGETRHLASDGILYCVGDLYFSEPEAIHAVFSETLGKELILRHLGNHNYELQLPEGKRNVYHYDKGKCTEVEVNHALGKARFVLR
ncbi:DUF6134 family protein [Chitinophaga sp. NPDC101104]|uniref:DUF6134 family protein n=1 Tax=Chitinophaga sp. NPDC101104 TaxID=3390561 RepID=UPI003D058653